MSAFHNIPDSGSPNWKQNVSTFSELPLLNNKDGDVRVALDENEIYIWNQATISWVKPSSGSGDKYVRTTRFAIISSGTSGTVTLPADSQVVLDDFGGTVDAVVAQASGGKPSALPAKDSSEQIVATTFDSSGNWSFTSTPTSYPVALVYRVRQQLKLFDSTASDIWGVSTIDNTTKANIGLGNVDNTSDITKNSAAVSLTNKTIDADLNFISNIDNNEIKTGAAIDATKIANGSVSNTEYQYLDGVTSAIQTQLNNKQPLDATLTSLAAYNTNGILTQTAADTFTGRTVTGTASNISVTNGSGVSGNPTIDLVNAGTAGTYKSPASITTDAKGRVTSVTAGDDFPIDPTLLSTLFDDFIAGSNSGNIGWSVSNSGTGTAPSTVASGSEAFNRAQGAMQISTGTTATGRSTIHLDAVMGIDYTTISQQWRFLISTLATVAEDYEFIIGFGDTPATGSITQTNEVSFVYNRATSANWICKTTAASVTTSTITATPVDITSFHKFRIDINSTGTSISFLIDGATVATHTTNIPGFLQFVGPLAKIHKLAGTTARTIVIDYFWQKMAWASAR